MPIRMWSIMDYVTDGRVGSNIVTSYSTIAVAIKVFGYNAVVPHDERYATA